MNKKLEEAWTTICHYNEEIIHDMGSEYVENPLKEEIDIVNNALLELKAIKEAKPSEALESVDYIENKLGDLRYEYKRTNNHRCDDLFIQEHIFNTIKQALIKAQEQEKVLSIIKEKNVDIKLLKRSINWLDYYTRVKHKTGEDTKLTQEEFDLLKRWLG